MAEVVSILVVDDEPDMVDLFKRQFRRELRQGIYTIVFAASGEEALAKLDAGVEPEVMLILSDINMPGMNGIDLLRMAKQKWPDLPVAMITAYGDPENRANAKAAGATDFITKPVDFADLKEKISRMLAQRGH